MAKPGKRRVRVFTRNGAMIRDCDETEAALWRKSFNALVDYDETEIRKAQPSSRFWKKIENRMEPMDLQEMVERKKICRSEIIDHQLICFLPYTKLIEVPKYVYKDVAVPYFTYQKGKSALMGSFFGGILFGIAMVYAAASLSTSGIGF